MSASDRIPLIESKDRFSSVFAAAVTASLASLCFGFTLGYTSPTELKMTTDGKDGHLVISKSQFSWFASLIAIGALFGSMLAGYFIDKFGRKSTIIMTSLLYMPGWCLISYASNVLMLYSGRILTGIAVGMSSLSVPVYIAEIASPRLRGGLGAINQLGVVVGIFIAYLVGAFLTWQWTAMFANFIVVAMVLLMLLMPETPRWLLAHGQRQLGLQGLQWLRGPLYDAEAEICDIENNLDKQEKASFRDFMTPGLYRPLIIGSMLMMFQQFCGINAVLFFDAKIFKSAGIDGADKVSLLVGGAQVLSTVVSCLIVDKLGRRLLLMVGSISMFLCTLLLGIYYDIAKIDNDENTISIFGKISHTVPLHQISWLAALCVIVYIIVFSIGWGPLPWLLMSEIFPPRARGFASGIVTFVNWLLVFVVTKFFHNMIVSFHEQGTFWFFSAFSLASFFFVFFCVPETKGKSLEDIEQLFAL